MRDPGDVVRIGLGTTVRLAVDHHVGRDPIRPQPVLRVLVEVIDGHALLTPDEARELSDACVDFAELLDLS